MAASTYELSPRTGDYFQGTVVTDRGWPIYSNPILDHAEREKLHVHEHQWTFGAMMNSLVAAGLRLEHFEEHPDLFWNQFPNLRVELSARLPHTFSLLMRKE